MNGAHLHLIINHTPVLGAVAVVSLLVWTKIKREPSLQQLSFVLMILVGFISVPAYLTGIPARKAVEHLPDITNDIIEHHHAFALYGLLLGIVIGLLGVGGLYLKAKGKKAFDILWWVNIVVCIIFMLMMFIISNSGGQIRHTEIRPQKFDTNY